MTKVPGTMEELESEAVARLGSIGRQLSAMLTLVVVITAGAAAWMTRTDMRLEGVEQAINILSTGAVADLQGRLRAVEREVYSLRSRVENEHR